MMTVRASLDGDRIWLVVNGQDVGFIRSATVLRLMEPTEFGPQELAPVIPRGEDRRQVDRRSA